MHLAGDPRATLRRVAPPVAVGLALAGVWWIPFVVWHGSMTSPDLPRKTFNGSVETRQLAPTILKALGLDPDSLDGVRKEKTQVLPILFDDYDER